MGRTEILTLLLLLPLLCGVCAGGASSAHSLRYFIMAVSDSQPGPGLPRFIYVGYVDEQLIVRYDSESKRARPTSPWMAKAGEEDPQYWDRETANMKGSEQWFRVNLATLRNRYNQSAEGVHIIQLMYGCDLSGGGYNQHSYDGRDFLSFDKETLTWTAADAGAQVTKRKWDPLSAMNQGRKAYLEETCPEWLRKYLAYGKGSLQRTEPPVVTVTRKEDFDGQEILVCRARGFYPKEVDASWTKRGENWNHETLRTKIAPNLDGTYHLWLSIKIDPKERDHYRCHVEHDGLLEPVDVSWEDPGSNMWLIVGIIPAVVVVSALLAVGIFVYMKKRQKGYKAASTSDKGSGSSVVSA